MPPKPVESKSRSASVRIRPAHHEDLASVYRLLDSAGLPSEGLSESNVTVYVSFDFDTLVATAALEHYGQFGLLRSVCVHPERRGQRTGRAMAAHVLQQARTRGLERVFLLTETAAEFFSSMGFRPVDRRNVPEGVRASIEFATLCPESAVAMAHTF